MKKAKKVIMICIPIFLLLVIILLTTLTLIEYKPQKSEPVEIMHKAIGADSGFDTSTTLSVLSWNIGYGGLSVTADFFMDGGEGVRTQDKDSVQKNLDDISRNIKDLSPDILFLQEIDRCSTRTYRIDETAFMKDAFPEMSSAFANNLKVAFLPYPIPPIGKVDSGIMTMTNLPLNEAYRMQLPIPFKWPVRTINLKRCLLVSRIPISTEKEGGNNKDSDEIQTNEPAGKDETHSGKELVLINLHLEAYDDGEGKEAQTKMLASFIQEEYDKGNYVIAGGDFNQSFSGTDTSMYPLKSEEAWQCGLLDEASFSDNFYFLMDNSAPTCRSLDRPYDAEDENFQHYLIDGFIVSDNIDVRKMETMNLHFVNSDHNPVYMEFTLR